jgi:hypothetical protein
MSRKAGLWDKISALVYLATVINAGYVAYLYVTEQNLAFNQRVLEIAYLFKPAFLLEAIGTGGVIATILGSITISVHYLAIGAGAVLTAFVITKFLFSRASAVSDSTKNTSPNTLDGGGYLVSNSEQVRVVLSVYVKDPDHKEGVSKTILTNVFPQAYIRLDRASVAFNRPPTSPTEKLERALWQILAKHKEWPADPNGHHAQTSLYDHSRKVMEKMMETTNGHPLARVIGLAHDIGKIIAYQKDHKLNLWKIRTKQHDALSAHIVRMLPEFREIPPDQQNTVDVVLAYSHKPDKAPKRRTTHQELSLLRHLRLVDGLATAEDKEQIGDLVANTDAMNEIKEGLRRLIPRLNINSVRPDGYADGWTTDILDYIAIKEASLRESLDGYLNPKLTIALGLKMDTPHHPATQVIRTALNEMGYLIERYAGHLPSRGMFSAKVGKVTFHNIFLLKRQSLEQEAPDVVSTWGNCKFQIKISHSSRLPVADENAETLDTPRVEQDASPYP